MKLARFTYKGEEDWGIVNEKEQTILSSLALEEAYFCELPKTIVELIQQGEEGLLLLSTTLTKHAEDPIAETYSLSEVTLLAPLIPQKNIFCVGKNYSAHVREFEENKDAPLPEYPILFSKPPTSIIGPGEAINLHPEVTEQVDYEGELAIIIGQRGSSIAEEKAYEYVFGYTIINDVTARDLQKKHVQWLLGKGLDTFCPMGPYIHISNHKPYSFTLHTHVNGELRQEGHSDELLFSIPSLIATISRGLTLEPGDIIATGTPYGVGMGFKPPRFLKSGDTVSITVDTIGTLTNTVK